MSKTGRAYFVDFPRIIEDLKAFREVEAEQEYEIVATVRLGGLD